LILSLPKVKLVDRSIRLKQKCDSNGDIVMVNIAQANPTAAVPSLPTDKSTGYLEVVTLFDAPMPIGVAVSKEGRIFISYPQRVDG
jgi:hypothetical protein